MGEAKKQIRTATKIRHLPNFTPKFFGFLFPIILPKIIPQRQTEGHGRGGHTAQSSFSGLQIKRYGYVQKNMPLTRRAAAIAASSGDGGAFVFNGGLTTSSLEYDEEEDNDAGQGEAVDRSAKNPTAQTWDAKRMAEERQRLQLQEMKEQLKLLEEKLEEPLRRMAWQQHRMEEGFHRSSSLGSLGMQIAMGHDPFEVM